MVQYISEVSPDQITRSLITLKHITINEIKAKILSSDSHRHPASKLYVCIALPNKFEKLELIVQKLTELQVWSILLFPSQRSLLRTVPDRKMQRLSLIASEAMEQSFGRHQPQIILHTSPHTLRNWANDIRWDSLHYLFDHKWDQELWEKTTWPVYTYIWPEWWFTPEEKSNILQHTNSHLISLGTMNLRLETAAIVSTRRISHSLLT